MRRGSPLTIPNREVKPDCADDTAFLWESRSPPSSRPAVFLIVLLACLFSLSTLLLLRGRSRSEVAMMIEALYSRSGIFCPLAGATFRAA